jgi:lycopene cyclase domain-containing protein
MSLYLLLNILVLSIPLLLSFDRKVHFYTHWKYFFPAMILTLAVFICWDVIFTHRGIWGFNERYLMGINLFGLPLEEYLFFMTVPYASVFTLCVLEEYFPSFRLRGRQVGAVSLFLVVFLLVLAVVYLDRAYTAVNFFFAAGLIGWVYFARRELLARFYPGYGVILVPFVLVNGVLTGSFIEEPVVWYNDLENLGIRVGTIPVEDIFYGMSLILMNYFFAERLRTRLQRDKIPAS